MGDITNFQFSITVNEEIVELVVTGKVTRDKITQLHKEILKCLEKEDIKALLIDLRAAQHDADTLAAAFFRVKSLPPNIRQVPSAIVDLNEDAAYISFYETAAFNVSQSLKWFTEIEVARKWLRSRL